MCLNYIVPPVHLILIHLNLTPTSKLGLRIHVQPEAVEENELQ